MVNLKTQRANYAIDVARKAIADPNTPATEIAEKNGVTRHSILHARVLLERGTAQELMEVTAGNMGLSIAYKAIKERMSPEEREKLKKRHAPTGAKAREKYSGEAAIWVKLGPALRGLSELPDPQDVIKVIMSHAAREATVNRHVNNATRWMEEFTNAWNKRKGTSAPEDAANAGNGNAASGAQHAKSAA